MDNIILQHINTSCCLCKDKLLTDDEVCTAVSCCHSIFHRSCLQGYAFYNITCPKCECNYRMVNMDIGVDYLSSGQLSYSEIIDIYSLVAKKLGYQELLKLDQKIQSQMTGISYQDKFKGYFPLSKLLLHDDKYFDNKMNNKFRMITYGIFNNSFDWKCFILNGNITEDGPLDFILYSVQYTVIQDRLKYFCQYILSRFQIDDQDRNEIPITVNKNKVTFYLPGFERGIVVKIIYKPLTEFCPDIFYDGSRINVTMKGLINEYVPVSSLDFMKGYSETFKQFQARTNLPVINIDTLCNYIYGDYVLHIDVNNTHNVAKSIYMDWYNHSDITQLVSTVFNSDAEEYAIYICSPYGERYDYDINVVNFQKLRKFIYNRVYLDRSLLLHVD